MKVYETDSAVAYLKKRELIKPYLKAKDYFEQGHTHIVKLKLLQPKKNKEYQFRINDKYRARSFLKKTVFWSLKSPTIRNSCLIPPSVFRHCEEVRRGNLLIKNDLI